MYIDYLKQQCTNWYLLQSTIFWIIKLSFLYYCFYLKKITERCTKPSITFNIENGKCIKWLENICRCQSGHRLFFGFYRGCNLWTHWSNRSSIAKPPESAMQDGCVILLLGSVILADMLSVWDEFSRRTVSAWVSDEGESGAMGNLISILLENNASSPFLSILKHECGECAQSLVRCNL